MARDLNTGSAPLSSTQGFEKAKGFVNFYLPNPDGSRSKIGFFSLKESNQMERGINEALAKDPTLVAKLVSSLIAEYRSAEIPEGKRFSLV